MQKDYETETLTVESIGFTATTEALTEALESAERNRAFLARIPATLETPATGAGRAIAAKWQVGRIPVNGKFRATWNPA